MSVGLGVIRFIFLFAIVAILLWLAMAAAAIALAVWAVYHVVSTQLARRPAVASPALGSPSLGAVRVPSAAANPAREKTNWLGVAAAIAVALATLPALRSDASAFSVLLAAGGSIAAVMALARTAAPSKVTSVALKGAAAFGALMTLFSLFGVWTDRPVTLYGAPLADHGGEMRSVDDAYRLLPCLDEAAKPALPQENWALATDEYIATISCHISADRWAQPAVVVEAASAPELLDSLARGLVTVDHSHQSDIQVHMNGKVAVITSDRDSAAVAEKTFHTYISLDDEPLPEPTPTSAPTQVRNQALAPGA